MYATRARQARPEAFTAHPGVAARLGLPYVDAPLFVASLALAAISVFVLAETTLRDVPGDPGYFADRQATYAVLGLIGMYVLARVDYSRFRALLAARLRLPLLQLPAIGAGQAPARTGACRLCHRWRPAGLGVAAHGALPLPRPRPGCARLPAARPRHRPGVRGHHPRRDVRRGRPVDAPGDDRRNPGGAHRHRPRRPAPPSPADPEGVPAGEAYLFSGPQRGPRRCRLPAESGQDRDRLR